MKPHRGTLILVLGILSIPCGGLFTGIPAFIMASRDLKEMNGGRMDPAGRRATRAGQICGVFGTFVWILVFINFPIRTVMHGPVSTVSQ